jgi:ABC-type glycerol-3-phosphate transport system substrate-binding protein
MSQKKFSRRSFLKTAGLAAVGLTAAACQPQTVIVKETVVVEGTSKVVEKEVTREVEKEVTREVAAPVSAGETVVTVLLNGSLLTEAAALAEGMLYTVHLMEYNLQRKGVTVRYEAWPGGNEYNTNIRLMTASGELEDVVLWGNWRPTSEYVNDNLLLPLDDLMDAAGVSIDEWVEPAQKLMRFDPDAKKLYEGPIWTMPIMGNPGVAFLFFNEDMLDAAGAPYPTGQSTWAEIEEIAAMVAKPDEGIFGLNHNLWGRTHGLGWDSTYVAPWGGAVLNEDGTKCVIDSEESVAAYKWMHDIRHTSRIAPTPDAYQAIGDYVQGTEAGKLAIYQMGGWGGSWFLMREENANPKMGYSTAPTSYDNNAGGWRGNTLEINWHGISANAVHPAECFDVLYWICNYEAGIFAAQSGVTMPHPRPDVLQDPVLNDHPFVQANGDAIMTAGVARVPANLRNQDIDQAIQQRMATVDTGETFPDKAFLGELRDEIQAVLDMDPA